jgi:hypothetical protein
MLHIVKRAKKITAENAREANTWLRLVGEV